MLTPEDDFNPNAEADKAIAERSRKFNEYITLGNAIVTPVDPNEPYQMDSFTVFPRALFFAVKFQNMFNRNFYAEAGNRDFKNILEA